MIQNAINSVLKQTYKDWELIIVDDGSKDKTNAVVNSYKKLDDRIKYFYQENQERSTARNNGIKKAIGDWVCFLDSDDIYHKNHLEEFKNLIKREGSKRGLYFSGLSFGKYSNSLEEYDLSYKNNIEFVLLNTIGTPRACAHKEILLKHKFDEKIKNGEDRELWVRILKDFPLFFHKKKTFIEIEHANRSVNLGSELESLKTVQKILKENKSSVRRSVRVKLLSSSFFNISKNHIKNKSQLKAIYYTALSLLINIRNKQTNHKLLLLLSMLNLYSNKIKNEYI